MYADMALCICFYIASLDVFLKKYIFMLTGICLLSGIYSVVKRCTFYLFIFFWVLVDHLKKNIFCGLIFIPSGVFLYENWFWYLPGEIPSPRRVNSLTATSN